jgi:hypothetical protein
MSKPQSAVQLIRQLSVAELRRRLAEIEAERKSLMVLLRAAVRRERAGGAGGK